MADRLQSAASAYVIRPAELADLSAITDIYNQAVLTTTATFDLEPRTLEAQRRWLQEHKSPYVALVAAFREEVVGWAALSPWRTKPGYRYTAEESVYVHPDYWGQGIGRLLLTELLSLAERSGFHTVIAAIDGGNAASLRLHRRSGFRQVGREREVGYKFDRWLDVIIMQKFFG